MSYRCQVCNDAQPPNVRPIVVVTAVREKEYFEGGRGWEIVKESRVCEPCEAELDNAEVKARAEHKLYLTPKGEEPAPLKANLFETGEESLATARSA